MSGFLRFKKTLLILFIAIAVIFYFILFPKNKEPAESGTGKVTRGNLVQRVTIAGTIAPAKRTLISAPYNGYVKKIYVNIGDQVKAGDPLVSFTQTLHSSDASFPIRAPFNGTVVQVEKTEGEYVRESNTKEYVLSVDDLSKLYVNSTIPEIDRLKVKVGQEAMIRASAILNRSYKGKIKEIYLSAKEKDNWQKSQVDFPVRVEVMDQDEQLRPGMSVLIDVVANKQENVLQLRHEFILKENDKYYAMLTSGKKIELQLGAQNEEAYEIKAGLNEGDEVKVVDFSSLIKAE